MGSKNRAYLTSPPFYWILSQFSLDRIERDEETYLEHIRASSLAYRAPPLSSETGGSSDHTQHPNSGCYPVVGVSSSSKLMSDILLQFHQEAESIDLLGVNAIQGHDGNAAEANENVSNASFFHKHQAQFQELFRRHQQKRRTHEHDTNINTLTNFGNAQPSSISLVGTDNEVLAEKDRSASRNVENDDVSHSSSMMMMSMNSSTTTMMSP